MAEQNYFRLMILTAVGGALLGVFYQYGILMNTIYIILHLLIVAAGLFLGVSWSLVRGGQYKPTTTPKEAVVASTLLQKMMEKRAEKKVEPKKVVISRNIDVAIQEVIDMTVRDFILSWYVDISKDQETLISSIRSDFWIIIKNFSGRLSKIDTMKFITEDVIEKLYLHFLDVRHSTRRTGSVESVPKFILHPWLENDSTERDFLSQICEVLLLVILPDHYKGCTTIRHMLREVLTSTAFKPTVDMVCDPDYINEKLIAYIDYRRQLSEDTRRTYTYAATYEDFVKMIDKGEDIEHLKQIRYNIITEIIQATTIKNLHQEQARSKSLSGKPGSPKGTTKGDLLKSRNLKRYINQLTVAKSRCEKTIHAQGGPDYKYYTEEHTWTTQGAGEKVLPYKEIMESLPARQEFFRFLKRDDNESLLGFWNAVEKLKVADKRQYHQIGSDIYHQYIASTTSVVKLDRTVIKSMESFLKGDIGPDAFFEAQDKAYQVLQKEHYPSFLVSDIYHRFMMSEEDEKMEAIASKDTYFFGPDDNFLEPEDADDTDNSDIFASQSYAAQQRVEHLDDKIRNKTQAIKALRESKKMDDAKIEKVEKDMEKELEKLMAEKKQLEAHILRMQTWCENQGKWRAHIYETETLEEGEKKIPIFVLIIHLAGTGTSQNLQRSSHGWVVNRTLQEFHKLHDQLVQIGPWLRKKDLPTIGRFTTVDDKFIQESKKTINEYLVHIMKDERMAQSEVLSRFLTPTPDYLKEQETEKKRTFFFQNFFKGLPKLGPESHETDDELLFAGDETSKLDRSKDSVAEPFYKLVSEVFELRGMFRWLRRSFIMFVEVTFGRSINRQLRDTVDWIFSEPMIIYYMRLFKDSMWPDGQLAAAPPPKSDEEKLKTRMEAKEKFLQNIPDAVKTLLGEDNARRGSIKIFEVLQDPKLNKNIFYVLIEIMLLELCPELTIKAAPLVESTAQDITNNG